MIAQVLRLIVLVMLALTAMASSASAQSAPRVQTALSDETVEVDHPVALELSVSYEEGGIPSNPTLKVPDSITVIGPHVFRSKVGFRTMGGGGVQQIYRARWQLVPSVVGTFPIPAPVVAFEGSVLRGEPVTLKVVPPGQAKRKRRQGFGGFGGFFSGPQTGLDIDLRDLFPVDPEELSATGEELAMPRAPDPHVFLRIVPDKTKAVVGEQVTLDYYVYARSNFAHGQPREPSLVDFSRTELDPPSVTRLPTRVGGQLWTAQLFRRIAVFPLRAGKLETGRVELDVVLPRVGKRELTRRSNNVVIDVREPPKEGRPPGYELGDVGRFKMAATVSPRETLVGETLSVVVKVTGVGQLPHDLSVPKRQGIEWLEPERKEDVRDHNGRVHGWRTFGYALRFTQPGTYDLGAIELPHYDPDKGQYEVARAELGKVRVKPRPGGASPSASPDEPDPFATLGAARPVLAPYEPQSDEGLDPRLLWSLCLVPSLAVVGGGFLARFVSNARRRRRQRRDNPALLAKRALDEASSAEDARDAAAAAERAMHLAIEARTGVKARGVLLAELGPKLENHGLDEALAREVVSLLDTLGTVRFAPSEESAGDLRKRSGHLVKKLLAS